MQVTVSGEAKTYEEGTTLAQLVEIEHVENAAYVTIAIGDELVRAIDFGERVLQDGDSVEFLYFMGGGAHGLH